LGIGNIPYLNGVKTENTKIDKPNLRNVEHSTNIEFNNMIDWAKTNYRKEYV
jgi:hypothetical protein